MSLFKQMAVSFMSSHLEGLNGVRCLVLFAHNFYSLLLNWPFFGCLLFLEKIPLIFKRLFVKPLGVLTFCQFLSSL